MSKSDHITALFVAGVYYLFYKNDKQMARLCFDTAVEVLQHYPFRFIGQA